LHEQPQQKPEGGIKGVLSMSLRIWLTAAGSKAIETKQETVYGKIKEVRRLEKLEVRSDEGSDDYITIYDDPLDPASAIPTVARKYVKRVSFIDKLFAGFRTNGIYKFKGATARIETVEDTGGLGINQFNRRYQTISISAGSVKTLREIYIKVRAGELRPKHNWGDAEFEPEADRTSAEAEAVQL
jgi:hypothetical protein